MRNIRRVSGVMAILVAVAGCAVATHTTATASSTLPTCDKTLLVFDHLSTELSTKARIPKTAPGPMRFCRYRWDSTENKLALKMDDEELKAPIAILKALTNLKTKNEVYGPNYAMPCPWGYDNADLIILQGARSKLSFIKVPQGGCPWIIVTHPGSTSYIVYVRTAQFVKLLDAITPTGGPRKNSLKIQVTPSTNLRDGQAVLVKVSGGSPGERFRISECATSTYVNINGCGDQPAMQPFIDADPSGSGSTTFLVRTKAATKTITTDFQTCTVKCVIMTTGTNFNGQPTVVYAPLKFSK